MSSTGPDGRIGSVLDGRYRILERIAQGGMGVVYRAERVPVGRPVAVKFLHALFADDPDSRSRFERETRALSKLAHPHCVSIIDFGVSGSPYLVMDHVAGTTLRELLDEGPLSIDEALALARQLLAGLAHAHQQRIVHRDVKPANIMVTDEIGTGRHVRILDFGLARLREHGAVTVTQTSMAIGTPSYMAPEQTVGGEVDARSDVYAAGVVLFEMLTGRRPFVHDEPAALLEAHRSSPPPRLTDIMPNRAWPAGLDTVLQRALAKAPEDRWPSAVDFAAALDAVARGDAPTIAATTRRGGGLRQGVIALALLIAASGAAYAGFQLTRTPAATESANAAAPNPGTGLDAGAPVAAPPAGGSAAPPLELAAAGSLPTPPPVEAADAATAVDVLDAAPEDDAAAIVDVPDAAAAEPLVLDAGVAAPPDEADDDLERAEPVALADPEAEPAEQAADTDDGEPAPVAPAPTAGTAKPATVVPARSVKEALAQIKRGQREPALQGLRTLWRKQPRNAQLPYLLGNLYHDKKWWSVAMEHYQAAIARNRAYRSNATIIRNVIESLSSTKTRAKASWFLRKIIGAPARRHLQTAAKRHPNPTVRRHAAAILKRKR